MVRTARWPRASSEGDRLRHGRHLDRRVALRRRVRARLRDPGRRRAHARADDGDPHRRRRRRLDPRASTARAFASARESAGANPGPACYRRGGPLTVTDSNVDARQDPAGVLSARVRAARRRAARRRRRRGALRRARARDRGGDRQADRAEAVADGFVDIAVGNMANAIKKISVARGHDVTALHAAVLRRRRRPARLPGRRRARHGARLHPSAGRRAVGLRHGPRRPDGDARGGARAAARRRARRRRGAPDGARRRRRAPSSSRRASRASGSPCTAASTCATRAPTRRSSSRSPTSAGHAGGVRGGVPAALRLPDARAPR